MGRTSLIEFRPTRYSRLACRAGRSCQFPSARRSKRWLTQMRALSLQTQDVNPSRSSNGYVFFPKGTYGAIEVNLLNEETEESAARRSSWETGKAQVPSTAPGFASSSA